MGAIVALLSLLVGAGLMVLFVGLSNSVTANYADIEAFEKSQQQANPVSTGGYAITATAAAAEQLNEARKIAAKAAAKLPRGANMGIGRAGTTDARKNKKHVTKGIGSDPMSELKIARFHTWNGLEVTKAVAAAPVAAAAATGGALVKRKLEPGKDYAFVDFKNLKGAEKRQAIIANGKAKYAAYKAAKAAGLDMVAEAAAPVAAAAAPVAAAAAAAPTNLPPAPTYIEITEGMDKAELRQAKIANSKAKSAYNKALKAMGIDPKSVDPAALAKAAAAAPVAAAAVAEAPPADGGGSADIPPPPEMIEITDGMDKDDMRAAKIANSKAKSAYKKQLKAMGIDPKSVKI